MRKRSRHSSIRFYTKDDSQIRSTTSHLVHLRAYATTSCSLKQKLSKKPLYVETWLEAELNRCKSEDNKLYNIIKILSNPYYLMMCYELLDGKTTKTRENVI